MRSLGLHGKNCIAWLPVLFVLTIGSGRAQTDKGVGTPAADAQTNQPATSPKVTSEEDLKKEEKQRILAVVPNFNVIYNFSAPPLSAKQKFDLALHTNFDAITFAASALTAGSNELHDQFSGYGWGAQGYAKRLGAAYADNFDGVLFGNAVLPILFHQDPRYFRLGKGTFTHRLFYSMSATVICKSDKGYWEPNYSNVAGNFVAGGISNAYYPAANRGLALTVQNALTVTAEGTIGSIFNEFFPDISHRIFKKFKKLDIDYDKPQTAPSTAPSPAGSADDSRK